MSKRFTETSIWDEDWFLEMPKEYKIFWFYLKDKCNHAGIWKPNLILFESTVKCKIDLNKAIEIFNKNKCRCQILNSGHWFILDFFVFQYGSTFNSLNRVHKSIQDIYNQEDIILTSIRGLKDLKDGVKDKDKDKDITTINKKTPEEKKKILTKRYLEFKKEVETYSINLTDWEKDKLLIGEKTKSFIKHWGEANKSMTKMKFEMQDTWSLSGRISTWLQNAEKYEAKELKK